MPVADYFKYDGGECQWPGVGEGGDHWDCISDGVLSFAGIFEEV